jgi:hypothetical protein
MRQLRRQRETYRFDPDQILVRQEMLAVQDCEQTRLLNRAGICGKATR